MHFAPDLLASMAVRVVLELGVTAEASARSEKDNLIRNNWCPTVICDQSHHSRITKHNGPPRLVEVCTLCNIFRAYCGLARSWDLDGLLRKCNGGVMAQL